MTIALTRPSLELFESWAEAVREFQDEKIHGFGIPSPVTADPETCEALVVRAQLLADTSRPAPDDWVHNDLYWITDAGDVVGFMSIRHELNEFLREAGGHIGYSIRPSRRRRGYASRALDLALARAGQLGLERVLVTCDDDNLASAGTIEKAGGRLEGVVDASRYGYPAIRRYWIDVTARSAPRPASEEQR